VIRIDEGRVFREIERARPRRVVFTAPDGILRGVRELALRVERELGVEAIVLGEANWGSCDTVEYLANLLGADIAFNIGHTGSLDRLGRKTVFVDAFDDVSFEGVLEAALPTLRRYGVIGLATTSQHLPALQPSKEFLESRGLVVLIGRGRGLLRDGQVFGCEFYPVYDIRDRVGAFALLGQSMFHAVGVALSTGKPTYMLDPYLNQVIDVGEEAQRVYRRAVLDIFRARDARTFGLIIGLREGQLDLLSARQLRDRLRKHGREVLLIALRDITEERLAAFRDIEAFIQTACPRLSTDDHFSKPVLSVPQAEALIGLWEGRDPGEFLLRAHWL
jgi:2-(3-amino-3-carboxypropyl)histidine synthase